MIICIGLAVILLYLFLASYQIQSTYGTHLSKPIITQLIKNSSNVLLVSGIADYFGPTSHVVISVLIKGDNDKVLALDSITSDKNGEFSYQLRFPSFSNSSMYVLEFMSQCRVEHRDFCTTRVHPFLFMSIMFETW